MPPQAPSLKHPVPSVLEQESEGYFLKAIAIARQQQGKALELRAIMSLVRLRQEQVQRAPRNMRRIAHARLAEAHTMLSDIYQWFTEGFATKDLQEAKALIEEGKRRNK